MLNDLLFFSIMLCHLPGGDFVRHMKQRSKATGMTLVECYDFMFPELASRIKRHLKRQQQIMSPHIGDDASTMTFEQLVGNKQPILLYGPPGTGKSYLITCCAVKTQVPALEIKCQGALSSKLGESEKLIAQQFDLAASSESKAVVIINEFESLCRRNKSSESAEWASTICKCFINIFDNLHNPAHEYFGVKVLLMTNFVDKVDAAVVDRGEDRGAATVGNVRKVDWERAATLAHRWLSIRGLRDVLGKDYRQLLELHDSPVATAELMCMRMRQQIGKIAPEAVKQPENFKCVKLTQMIEGERVMVATCLARAGWCFGAAPSHIYRQIFSLDDMKKDAVLILRKTSTGELFTGIGCYVTLKDGSSSDFGFQNYHVYVQCKPKDASLEVCARTTSVLLKSYGQTGVRRFNWEYDTKFENLGPPTIAMSIESFLTPLMRCFVRQRVYIETRSTDVLLRSSSMAVFKTALVYSSDFSKYITGREAEMLVGYAPCPKAMNNLGYRVFIIAESSYQLVNSDVNVLYASQYDDGKALIKIEVEPGRFVICEHFGATVADALRRNGIYYAAIQGIFVRWMQPDDSNDNNRSELYAVPITPGEQGKVWTGDALATFEKLSGFRAKYALFGPCTGARRVLSQGVSIIVDTQKINELPTPECPLKIALLRLYLEEANG